MAKKLLVWGSLALILTELFRSWSSNSDEPNLLRGGAEIGTKLGSNNDNIIPPNNAPAPAVEPPAPAAVEPPPPPPADEPPPPPADEPPPPPAVGNTSLPDPSVVKGKSLEIEKGVEDSICGSQIPINLADKDKWPTPYTPFIGNGKVPTDSIAKEVVLLQNGSPYGNLGSQLTSFFHAYDFAHESKAPLYITKDSWALETLSKLFFDSDLISPANIPEKFYPYLEKILRVKIVESEEVLKSMEITVPHHPPVQGFFHFSVPGLDLTQIRNHRETILRQLLQYPAPGMCTNLEKRLGAQPTEKYTVISFNFSANIHLPKLDAATKKDHTAAAEMQPDYVVNILGREGMLEQPIFPVFPPGPPNPANVEALMSLIKNPLLHDKIRYDLHARNLEDYVYLALLADVYLGNPVDPLSIWIARIRAALNKKQGTYVLTEKQGDDWVSYVDNANHLDLYDEKLDILIG